MNLRANKRLGQHFLHDPAIIEKIVETIAPQPDDLMVEIGGGHGALTFPLVKHLNQLHVYLRFQNDVSHFHYQLRTFS